MPILNIVDPTAASGKARNLLDAVKSKLGIVPNMTKVMANSPAVLEGYLGLSGALGGGLLDAQTREQLALATAQQNQCNYCLSAHTAIGKMVGLNPQQILESRKGNGTTPRTSAALTFTRRVLDTHGQITENDLSAVREAGFDDGEIAEILAHVALNIFTNYFNIAAGVEIDFPKVSFREIA